MRTIKITVDIDTIVNAVTADSHHCMIADALQAVVPEARFIMVDLQSIRFTDKERGLRYIFLTPPVAQQALLDFDKGKRVAPFEFTMSQGHTKTLKKDRTDENEANRKRSAGKKRVYTRGGPVRLKREREFGLRMFTAVEAKDSKRSKK